MKGVLEKALMIIDELAKDNPIEGKSVTAIAMATGLNASTVFRQLKVLEQGGVVVQNGDSKKYRLGQKIMGIGLSIWRNLDLRKVAYPWLEKLTAKTLETSHLVILSGHEAIFVEQIVSPLPIQLFAPVGTRYPLYSGASRKLLLAYQTPEFQEKIFKQAEKAKIKVSELQSELKDIRAKGYSTSFGEAVEGAAAVAAPIMDHSGDVIAALALAGPKSRFQQDRLGYLIESTIAIAKMISRDMGLKEKEM